MEISGNFNEADAVRTLIVREELVKLRQQGLEAPQAVEELIERIRSLVGVKKRNHVEEDDINDYLQFTDDQDDDEESEGEDTSSDLQEQRRRSSPKRKKRKHKIVTEKESVKESEEDSNDALTAISPNLLTNSATLDNMSSLFISEEEQVHFKRRAQHEGEFDAPKKKLKSKNTPEGSVVL
jgi:hypothetical protein